MTRKFDRYKLETVFDGDEVIHTTYESNLALGLPEIEVTIRWKRKKTIGEGGFGTVWLEEEVEGKKIRAVKRLPRAYRGLNWSRELDTLAKLKDNKAFVQFFGWFENNDFIFIAMEYIEHGDLSQYLKAYGLSARLQAKEIIRQLLEGLVVLHERNICHRDLKPQNVLVASLSPIWVKIADFGSSKREKGTKLRTLCGTFGYLAPELLRLLPKSSVRNLYTNSVDIWCLGVIAHEILTSEIPFLDTTTLHTTSLSASEMDTGPPVLAVNMELLYEYCHGHRKFPVESLQNSKISEKGVNFVMRLLVANPSSRITAKDALKSPWLLDEAQEIGSGTQIEPSTDISHSSTAEVNVSPTPTFPVPMEYLECDRRAAVNLPPVFPPQLTEHVSWESAHELDQYKLEPTFNDSVVVHTTDTSYLSISKVGTRWVQKREIGSGEFGTVWLEKEENGSKLRAVKKLSRELQKPDFFREVNTLVKLNDYQDLFARFLGWFEHGNYIFLSMEYVQYGDLSDYLKESRTEARLEVKGITRQLLEGLVILDEKNIRHRDLEPQNVLVASLSPIRVKIAHFGLSKPYPGVRADCATLGYFAPELLGLLPSNLRGNVLNNALDMWSLGVLVHEILTWEIPFLATDIPSRSNLEKVMGTPLPGVDIGQLFEYCHGYEKFPVDRLRKFKISEEGINFVKSLLVVNPLSRATARGALNSPWLLDKTPEKTSPKRMACDDDKDIFSEDNFSLELLGIAQDEVLEESPSLPS